MMPAPNDGILTEEIVLRCSRQYDVDAVRFVVLHGLRLRKLGDGFAKCSAIVRLDISRNNLTSLSGIEPTAGSLQYLNAAENLITDVSAVKECKLLEVVMLEGNRIGSEAALRPLAQLPELRQLVLKREVALEDADETLELDNPVCEKGGYEEIIRRYFSSVMFVDGCYMLNEATSDVVTSVFKPLPPLDTLKAPQDSNAKADVEERLFVNVVAECAEACRKALALR
ncbi:leucine-rich repeat protein (LRRP), putative [Trypanosoma equiperdum]|uniref:Leucine-rich repeat protein (LRRP) n=2 Tax=Trypanozoon TaxID=39700 RepID=Q38A73_TRYB2|nr:hypothetical protein, conserved [Trypanosoma brucei brucei TREU927]EAN78297.1 hypothetical protein, conserved [Trypanosoma brucei brucei TREU927]SCU71294.1 leucine-rich repeat protein (LRRP), putative [Trypanosoma equiperdum]